MSTHSSPSGELATRTLTMPADTNGVGNIFGGWVMSQMDIAGSIGAARYVTNIVVTIAVDAMHFVAPVKVSDVVSCYTHVKRVGTTSITVHVEAWVNRRSADQPVKVTEADFTFVAIGPDGQKTNIELRPGVTPLSTDEVPS